MNKLTTLTSKKIIIFLCTNYCIFAIAFLTLGMVEISNKTILWINFILDIVICLLSAILNIILFSPKYKIHFCGKITLSLITLCLAAFTYFAFLLPENGLPPALFY